MQNSSIIQDTVRSLSYEDKVYLSLLNHENMTDEEIIGAIISVYDHIKTMQGVISGGFKYEDAPTPKENNQALMIDDFNQKGQAFLHLVNGSKELLKIFVDSYLARESASRQQ